jgi:uncharacterized membrane protein
MIDAIYNFLEGLGYTHPIHAPLTHMPEGLVAGALVFALAAWAFRRSRLAVTARHCLILALIFLFPTAIAGYMDWQHFYGGAWLTIFKIKLLLTGLLLILLIVCLLFIPEDRPRYAILLPLYFLCFLAVAVLGYLGGQLALGERCFEAPPGAFSAGARIFRVNCSACHPQGGNIINPKLPVMGAPELANSQAFLTYLRQPTRPDGSRGSMPPFPAKRLPDPEVKELYAYIINVLEKKGR